MRPKPETDGLDMMPSVIVPKRVASLAAVSDNSTDNDSDMESFTCIKAVNSDMDHEKLISEQF